MLESPIVKEQYVIGTDTMFDFGVKIFDPADVSCYVYNPDTKTEYMLTSGTDFSVGLKPGTTDYSNGARITLLTEQPANGKLTIIRSVVPVQNVTLPNFGKIPSESLEAQLDRTEAAVQQLTETVQLCYKIPWGQSGTLTPLDSIREIITEMGGGGGGGVQTWVASAGYAESLDSNFVVKSATYATSAQYLGGATKAQLLASASSSTVSSASSCTYLGGATKQQVINSAVESAGGGGGGGSTSWGSLAPGYGGTQLTPGTTYQTEAAGTLRISLRDVPADMTNGCFTITINGVSFGLLQFKANTPGETWFIRLDSGNTFNVPTVYNANVLVMYDKGTHVYDD